MEWMEADGRESRRRRAADRKWKNATEQNGGTMNRSGNCRNGRTSDTSEGSSSSYITKLMCLLPLTIFVLYQLKDNKVVLGTLNGA